MYELIGDRGRYGSGADSAGSGSYWVFLGKNQKPRIWRCTWPGVYKHFLMWCIGCGGEEHTADLTVNWPGFGNKAVMSLLELNHCWLNVSFEQNRTIYLCNSTFQKIKTFLICHHQRFFQEIDQLVLHETLNLVLP